MKFTLLTIFLSACAVSATAVEDPNVEAILATLIPADVTAYHSILALADAAQAEKPTAPRSLFAPRACTCGSYDVCCSRDDNCCRSRDTCYEYCGRGIGGAGCALGCLTVCPSSKKCP